MALSVRRRWIGAGFLVLMAIAVGVVVVRWFSEPFVPAAASAAPS